MRKIIFIFWIGLSCGLSFGQNSLKEVVNQFENHRQEFLQEKLYVHLSQTFLLTGETLWFKVYVVDGVRHRLMDLSKVAYLELLDSENTAVLQAKIALTDGEGDGALFIPASLKSGIYALRCYTRWMRNGDPDFFYQEQLTIVNPFQQLEPVTKAKSQDYDIQFFPEGGNLVDGLESKIAFKISDSQGVGTDFSGRVVNSSGETVTTFAPSKFGIGSFYLTPENGDSYKAFIDGEGNDLIIRALPQAYESGLVMRVVEDDHHFEIRIQAQLKADDEPMVHLFAHTRGKVVWIETKYLKNDRTVFILNKDEMGEGITHLTLFNSKLQPVCERLVFIPYSGSNFLKVEVNKNHQKRALVKLKVMGADSLTHMSVSVNKLDSLEKMEFNGIFHYLGLTSDLKGWIESPSYYFEETQEAKMAMDHLMLTHGWRRFKWEQVFEPNWVAQFFPEHYGHVIVGQLHLSSGKNLVPSEKVKVLLSSPDKAVNLYSANVQKNGVVYFNVQDFLGPRKVILQADPSVEEPYRIEIQNPFSLLQSSVPRPSLVLSPDWQKSLLARSVNMQVQDIYFQKEMNQFSKAKDTQSFYGAADRTYRLDDYTRFPVMEEVMREYVPEVLVRRRSGNFTLKVMDKVGDGIFHEEPLVLLDGVPIFDIDRIMDFDPNKVEKLDVLTKRYYLGAMSFSGIVSYTTYKGDLAGYEPDSRAVTIDYEGLQRHQEFYSPIYEDKRAQMPDRRHLLYWNPEVVLKQKEEVELTFYTSDVSGEYEIRIEAISETGHPSSVRKIMHIGQ